MVRKYIDLYIRDEIPGYEEKSARFRYLFGRLRTTAEDFGFYCTKYPSLFYRLGVGAAAGRPHKATFNPDEGAIDTGIDYMKRLALQILKK